MSSAALRHTFCCFIYLSGLLLAAGCSPQSDRRQPDAAPLGTGYFEGTATLPDTPGQVTKLVLELRHPRPGHYDAELVAADQPGLSFVADTIDFQAPMLSLRRPGYPAQRLTLTRDGDFWRGTLALDSIQAAVLLIRRGAVRPMVYRVEKVAHADGPAWLFAPADIGTPSAALTLLPDAATTNSAAIWADALARQGLTVLVLPPADTAASSAATAALLAAAHQLLRNTPGTDSTNLGIWATGPRADAVAQALAAEGGPTTAFFIIQNAPVASHARTAYRTLARRKLPMLGLYGGPGSKAAATSLRRAIRGRTVRGYPAADSYLLVPGIMGRHLVPGLPDEVVKWLPRH